MKAEDVRIDDTATLLAVKRKINEIIDDVKRVRTGWQGEDDSVHELLKAVEEAIADTRGNLMAAASLILNEEVDKVAKEDRS